MVEPLRRPSLDELLNAFALPVAMLAVIPVTLFVIIPAAVGH